MIPQLFAEQNERIHLIDFSGIIYRSLHSPQAQSISTYCGDPCAGPIVMLFGSIMKVVQDFPNPVFVLDGWPKWKVDLYPEYKSSRKVERDKDPDKEFKKAMKVNLRNALLQYIPTVLALDPNEEADDSIASLSTQLSAKGVNVGIVSSDKDLWQLLDTRVKIHHLTNTGYIEVTPQKIEEVFGTTKDRIALYKTWLGDDGDDVPKVFRLPTKLALTLINGSNSLEDSIENIPKLLSDPKVKRWKEALMGFEKQARINWELVNAKRDLEVGFAYFRSDPNILQQLLARYHVQGFTSHDIHQTMIPHQEKTLAILNRHGFLKKILKFEDIYKTPK